MAHPGEVSGPCVKINGPKERKVFVHSSTAPDMLALSEENICHFPRRYASRQSATRQEAAALHGSHGNEEEEEEVSTSPEKHTYETIR